MLQCSTPAAPLCGVSAELVAIVEALGLARRQGGRLIPGDAPADPVRARVAVLGLHVGLRAEELGELLALYDASAPEARGLGRFVELLARYQRFVSWRARVGQAEPGL